MNLYDNYYYCTTIMIFITALLLLVIIEAEYQLGHRPVFLLQLLTPYLVLENIINHFGCLRISMQRIQCS